MRLGLLSPLLFFLAFSSLFGAVLNISVMSALADIADEHELNTGCDRRAFPLFSESFLRQGDECCRSHRCWISPSVLHRVATAIGTRRCARGLFFGSALLTVC